MDAKEPCEMPSRREQDSLMLSTSELYEKKSDGLRQRRWKKRKRGGLNVLKTPYREKPG